MVLHYHKLYELAALEESIVQYLIKKVILWRELPLLTEAEKLDKARTPSFNFVPNSRFASKSLDFKAMNLDRYNQQIDY